jgi:hypothetical protein
LLGRSHFDGHVGTELGIEYHEPISRAFHLGLRGWYSLLLLLLLVVVVVLLLLLVLLLPLRLWLL